jgi:hypothetical protein
MSNLESWTSGLCKAEQELDAATKRTDVNAATEEVMLAKAELMRLEQKTPTRQGSGVAAPAASS